MITSHTQLLLFIMSIEKILALDSSDIYSPTNNYKNIKYQILNIICTVLFPYVLAGRDRRVTRIVNTKPSTYEDHTVPT